MIPEKTGSGESEKHFRRCLFFRAFLASSLPGEAGPGGIPDLVLTLTT
jgi:hypothetical protein